MKRAAGTVPPVERFIANYVFDRMLEELAAYGQAKCSNYGSNSEAGRESTEFGVG